MSNTTRSSSIGLRVSPDEKQLVERAATLSGNSRTSFVRNTVLAAAREVVRAHEVPELMAEEAAGFVEALEPNENLHTLVRDYVLARKHRSGATDKEQGLWVVIEDTGGSYSAYSPDLLGCVATGDTREEVEANMREAMTFHLEGLMELADLLADPEARQALAEAEAQIERGEGLSFKEAFGEELENW